MSSFDPYPSDIGQSPGSTAETGSSMPSMPVSPACPWGPWATIGWTVICIVVMFVIQSAVLIVFFVVWSALNPNAKLDALFTNGNVLALSTLASTPVVVGLVALLVSIRRYPIRAYLALIWPPGRQVLLAIAGLAVLLVTSDLISYSLGRPLVPPIMVEIYQTAWLPCLLFALMVLAPLGEETLFRGFLYKGIAASRAGPVGAILVSSVAWALLHVQYDWYGIVSVAAVGLYLSLVRYKTASVWVTMLLHAISNTVATAEVIIQSDWLK